MITVAVRSYLLACWVRFRNLFRRREEKFVLVKIGQRIRTGPPFLPDAEWVVIAVQMGMGGHDRFESRLQIELVDVFSHEARRLDQQVLVEELVKLVGNPLVN